MKRRPGISSIEGDAKKAALEGESGGARRNRARSHAAEVSERLERRCLAADGQIEPRGLSNHVPTQTQPLIALNLYDPSTRVSHVSEGGARSTGRYEFVGVEVRSCNMRCATQDARWIKMRGVNESVTTACDGGLYVKRCECSESGWPRAACHC